MNGEVKIREVWGYIEISDGEGGYLIPNTPDGRQLAEEIKKEWEAGKPQTWRDREPLL